MVSFPPPDDQPAAAAHEPPRMVVFEDLTLAQVLAYLVFRPAQTWRLLWQVLIYDPAAERARFGEMSRPADAAYPGEAVEAPVAEYPREDTPVISLDAADGEAESPEPAAGETVREHLEQRIAWLRVVVLAAVVWLALRGGAALHAAALDPALKARFDPAAAPAWFVLASLLYAGFEVWASQAWWARRLPELHERLRTRFVRNELQHIWTASLLGLIMFVVLIALAGIGGIVGGVLLVAAAVALWIVTLLGNLPLEPVETAALPEVEAPAVAPARDLPGDAYVVRSVVRAVPAPGDDADRQVISASRVVVAERGFWAWFQAHAARLMLVPAALVCSSLAYHLNVAESAAGTVSDVVITTDGGVAWALSIFLWAIILGARLPRFAQQAAPVGSRRAWLDALDDRLAARLRALGRSLLSWPLLALVVVIGIGAVFRLFDVSSTPPEMTSDHIEKLLDALRVHDGYRGVFFPNNGGREGFQMYVVALIAGPFDAGFNFDALKLATVVEGLLTLPALWWMARQVIGTDTETQRRLGTWTGVALAGLVAVSSWHVMLSRLGLRIVLTPLTTALVIGFLARAMRHNRMRDYTALGFVLGAGTYFYQANRMLPLVVMVGIGLAARVRRPGDVLRLAGEVAGFAALSVFPLLVVWYAGQVMEQSGSSGTRDAGERIAAFLPMVAMAWFSVLALFVRARRRDHTLQVGGGLLATIVLALAVYIPMYHYSEIRPDEFWNRTRGRMFGEEAFWRTDPTTGATVVIEPTIGDQVELFWERRDVFVDNYADALRMFQWEGDGAWINNAGGHPAMDAVAGGLLVLGLVVWGVWGVRRRDPVILLLPVAVLIMLLPSAMTLAYTIENPSFTRASGAIPPAYMLAALPLGLLCARLAGLRLELPPAPNGPTRHLPVGAVVAVILAVGVAGYALGPNWDSFFTDYRLSYSYSWKPYSEIARPMREFAQGDGSYGNAFMVAYPHWLDHRILGTMAGDIRWPNGLVQREDLVSMIERNAGTAYAYDPDRPLFVMFHPDDMGTMAYLAGLFPGGETRMYEYSYPTPTGVGYGSFLIYEVRAGPIE